jgi:hypothetical protein
MWRSLVLLLPCPECCETLTFEQPPCEDGHGFDCPEWICTGCGYAMLLATYPEVDLPVPTPLVVTERHAA